MRVLILNSACCWRKSNAPFVNLGESLAKREVDVQHLVGGGEVCSFYGSLEDWTDEKCFSAQDQAAEAIKASGNVVHNVRSFETPEMRACVDTWWEEQKGLSPAERRYKGFLIRNLIRGSLARRLRRPLHPDASMPGGEEDGSAEDRVVAQRMARAAALAIEIAEASLQEIQPDVVLVFNGYFYLEWIFSAVAQRMGIRSVAHEIACFADRMFFDPAGMIGNRHAMSSSMLAHRMDAQEFSTAQQDRLEAYLKDIYEGRVNTIAQAETENVEDLRERLELPKDKKIVLLIGQVAYDTVVIYDSGTYSTALDFLRAGIEVTGEIPDCHLIIRLHPHEVAVNDNWTWRQLQTWDLPEHVTVVHSRQANTYQIMELADCGIAMTSQAGLEMTAFGKPVVVCGNAFYKNKGFTYDISRPEQLNGAIECALADGRLTPDCKRKLDIYLYHHIFNYLVPFDTENDAFSEEAVDQILKIIAPIAGKALRAQAAEALPEPENVVPNPSFEENLEGWVAADADIERIESEAATGENEFVLKCSTNTSAWSGVLYGCAKTNDCDASTLTCEASTRYTVSVNIKGESKYEDAVVQLHAIGSGDQNFGTAKATMTDAWQELSLNFTTKPDSEFVGIQIVKYNCPQPVIFLVDTLKLVPKPGRMSARGSGIVVKNPDSFPRLLLINEVPFGNHTGYGVTVTNLFRGWPQDKLAQIYRMIDYEPDPTVCQHNLPLYDSSRDPDLKNLQGVRRFVTGRVKLAKGLLDTDSGAHRANVKRALAWARPFQPEVIFTSPVTYATARFAQAMSRKLGVPYICHIMDDWLAQWEASERPECNTRYEPMKRLSRNRITKNLFANASARQVISSSMADAYKIRYGYEFSVMHNAVDLKRWDLGEKDYAKCGKPFRILYTGAIWWNIQMPTLEHFAKAIGELAADGHRIQLEIYTHPNFESQYAQVLRSSPHVTFCGLAPYEKMPHLMHEADALLVPVTFKEELMLFSQFSMPTKVPECMISGTPTILYGPSSAAPVEYAIRGGWGYVIDQPDMENLKRRIVELMKSPKLREDAGVSARQLARERHNLETVREAFWDEIKETLKN